MGIFDLFSADYGKNQAQKGYNAQTAGIDYGKAATLAAQTQGTGALTDAEAKARADYLLAQQQAVGALGQGQSEAQGYYGQLWPGATAGYDAYGNFFGLGGQQGFDTANQQWQSSPLYQAMVGESSLGQQALDRQAAAGGNRYNATDTLAYQGQLAGKYLGDYISGLRPYLDIAPQLAGSQANLTTGYGQNLANVYTGTGQQLGSAALGTGGNLSNVYTGTGSQLAGLGQAQGQAGYQLAADKAAAEYGAAKNIWDTVLGLTNAGATAIAPGFKAGGAFT